MGENNKDSIRTPLGRARGLGSAKDGTHHWWMQRVSSIALIPLLLYLAAHARYFLPGPDFYPGLIALIGEPVMSAVMILAVICGFYHAALGVQVIVEDYVHCKVALPLLLVFNQVFFFFAGVSCIYAVFHIGFALNGGR